MRFRRLLASAAISTALMCIGCNSRSEDNPPLSSAPPAAESPSSAGVQPTKATSDSRPLEILSVLSVERSVDLLAQRDGVVQEIAFDQDSFVKKGATLARMDDREIQAKLDKARLDLEVTQNNLKFQQAERKAKDAAYRRQKELQKFGLTSDAALEEAEFKSTGAAYDEKSWEAAVEQKQAEIRGLELELEKTRILAPFSGYVVRRSIRAGQNLLKNDVCFRLSELYPLQVHFLVPETSGDRPKAGDTLNVAPAEGASREFQARVRTVSPTIDPSSGSYDVMAELTGNLSALRPGMAVKVLWPRQHSKGPH